MEAYKFSETYALKGQSNIIWIYVFVSQKEDGKGDSTKGRCFKKPPKKKDIAQAPSSKDLVRNDLLFHEIHVFVLRSSS